MDAGVAGLRLSAARAGLKQADVLDGRAIRVNRPAADAGEAAELLVRALLRRYGGEDGLREAIMRGAGGHDQRLDGGGAAGGD